jgi:hypothetical protein
MVEDIERAIELCLSRAGPLGRDCPERDALIYQVGQLRRVAEIITSGGAEPEPIKSYIIAASARDGLEIDDEVIEVVGRVFRNYETWCRQSRDSR